MTTSFLPEGDAPSLQPEVARMFRQIGLQFVRASLVDMASLGFQPAWSISDSGEVSDGPSERGTDGAFPGAAALVGGLAGAALDHTRVQRLSPRRWAYTWLVSDAQAIVAEAHYRDKHDAVNDIETMLVRLVCSASARPNPGGAGTPSARLAAVQAWPHVERRARTRPSASAWIAVALPALAALLCGWLALSVLPQAELATAVQQARISQLDKAASATLTSGLATALATGDYGQLQDELWRFFELGYFQSALVSNAKGRVVALAGTVDKLRIGDAVSAAYSAQARAQALTLGAQTHGELLLIPPPAAPAAASLRGAQMMAGAAAVACAAATLMLLFRLRRNRGH